MSNSEALEQLSKMIADHLQRQQSPGPVPQGGFGLPQPMPMMGGIGPQIPPLPTGTVPQPTGVSVAVNVPLPDGREVSVRVHFGPEAAANLQHFAMLCAQMFGPYLAAKSPYTGRWNGYTNSRYGRR
jgi:hypothetical protein